MISLPVSVHTYLHDYYATARLVDILRFVNRNESGKLRCLWRLRRSENSSTLDLRPTQDATVADTKRLLCVADLSASQVIAGSNFC
jgi:hypothetical protein